MLWNHCSLSNVEQLLYVCFQVVKLSILRWSIVPNASLQPINTGSLLETVSASLLCDHSLTRDVSDIDNAECELIVFRCDGFEIDTSAGRVEAVANALHQRNTRCTPDVATRQMASAENRMNRVVLGRRSGGTKVRSSLTCWDESIGCSERSLNTFVGISCEAINKMV